MPQFFNQTGFRLANSFPLFKIHSTLVSKSWNVASASLGQLLSKSFTPSKLSREVWQVSFCFVFLYFSFTLLLSTCFSHLVFISNWTISNYEFKKLIGTQSGECTRTTRANVTHATHRRNPPAIQVFVMCDDRSWQIGSDRVDPSSQSARGSSFVIQISSRISLEVYQQKTKVTDLKFSTLMIFFSTS